MGILTKNGSADRAPEIFFNHGNLSWSGLKETELGADDMVAILEFSDSEGFK